MTATVASPRRLGPRTRTARRPVIEIEPRVLDEQEVAIIRRRVELDVLPSWLAATHGIIATHLQRIGVATTGMPFARLHEYGSSVDVEAGYPVGERITPKDEVGPATLPGGPVVVGRRPGDLDMLGEALDEIDAWLQQRGEQPVGAPWVIRHTGPSTGSETFTPMIEVRQPYLD